MTDPYCPDLAAFCDILRDYSQHGLGYFKDQSQDRQQTLRQALGGSLENKYEEIERKLAEIKNGSPSRLRFLPMPRPAGRDFMMSFFLPRIWRTDDQRYMCSFVVLFWVERELGKTIAVRLEPSGEADDAHSYTHLQLTRTILSPTITSPLITSLDYWVPESYPAVPLGYDHPVQLFVGMAVAVHGYRANNKKEYARAAIQDSMLQGASAIRARQILDEMKRMLG